MCVYTYTYIHTYIYIYIYVCMYIYINIYIYIYIFYVNYKQGFHQLKIDVWKQAYQCLTAWVNKLIV